MATLHDERLEEEEINEHEEVGLITEEPVVEQEASPEDDIPDKYKGKSTADIVRMHQEDKAVAKAIQNHPSIKAAEAQTQQYKQTTALSQLSTKHPDMQDIVTDPKFAEWIKGSKIRTQLFVQADQSYDHEAADELFTNWKERQGAISQTVATEKTERKKAVKNASTGGATGSGEASSRKVYRRSDIIKLMKEDPDRYMALSDEITQAYAQGRVR